MDAFEAISLPEPSPLTAKKCFTVTEANRALTLVRRIVTDIVTEYQKLRSLHEAHQKLNAQGNIAAAEQAREQYACVTDHLSRLREELEDIGCTLSGYNEGRVDFPARLEGRDIQLSWKLGEETIQYWHETDADLAERQPIIQTQGTP